MKRLIFLLSALLITARAHAANVGELIIPAAPTHVISASWSNFTLDGATDQIEFMFQCEEACAIDGLCVRQGTTGGTPPQYGISLQGVNTSGRADGTIKSSSNAVGNLTLPGVNAVACNTLTSSYTCTKGEHLAAVLYPVGTPNGTDNAGFSYQNGNALGYRYPMSWTVDAGSATYRSGLPPFGYKCGSTYYGFLPETSGQHDFGANSDPDERGNRFKVPAGSCSTFKLGRARAQGYMTSSANTLTFVVYEGTTVRQDAVIDTDYDTSGSTGYTMGIFDENYTFSCGTEYRIVIKPSSTSSVSTGLQYLVFDSNAHQNSLPLGIEMYYTGRADAAGSWTDDTSKRALIDLFITDITAAGGGSNGGSTLNLGLN